eukprot:6193624-Pleurochrysis_carterae.AAC.1
MKQILLQGLATTRTRSDALSGAPAIVNVCAHWRVGVRVPRWDVHAGRRPSRAERDGVRARYAA